MGISMATVLQRIATVFRGGVWIRPSIHKTETGTGGVNNQGARDMVRLTISASENQTSDNLQVTDYNQNLLAGIDATGNTYQSGVASAKFCVTQVTLTAANIIAMFTAPVAILPAPAAGVAIIVDSLVFQMKATATQFTGGGLVTFEYHGTAILVTGAGDGIPSATVKSATSSNNLLSPVAAVIQPPAATGVDITNASGVFAAGTGTAVVTVAYWLYTQQ